MDSDQTLSQSGSLLLNSDNNINNYDDKNDRNGGVVDSTKISVRGVSIMNSDDDDNEEGFLSGGEEFEAPAPVSAQEVFVKRPVAVVTEDFDDDEVEEDLGVGVNGEVFKECDEVKVDGVRVNVDEIDEEKFEALVDEASKIDVGESGKGAEELKIGDDVEKDEVLVNEAAKTDMGESGEGDDGEKDEVLEGGDVVVDGGAAVVGSDLDKVLGSGVTADEKVEAFVDSNGEKESEVPKLDTDVELKGDGIEEKKSEALKSEVAESEVETEKGSEVLENVDVKLESAEAKPALESEESANLLGGKDSVVEAIQVDVVEPGVVVVGEEEEVSSESPVIDSSVDAKLESAESKPALESEEIVNLLGEKDAVVESVQADVVEPGVVVVGEEKEASLASPLVDSIVEKNEFEVLEPEKLNVAEEDDVAKAVRDVDLVEVKEKELVNESSEISPVVEKDNSEELFNGSDQTSHVNKTVDSDSSTNKIADVEKSETLDVNEKELEAEFIKQFEEAEDEFENADDGADMEGLDSEEETDGMIFGGSAAAKQFIEELEREAAGSRFNAQSSQEIDGQIVTDSEEEEETDGEGGDEKEVFDSATLAALLKAATGGGGGSDGGNITITSQDGSRLFSIERPAGLGSTVRSSQPIGSRVNRSAFFAPPPAEPEKELSAEEKKKLDSLQKLRVKFLRLVHRLGASPDESVASQVLYRLALVAGRPNNQAFSLDAAKRTALELEAEGKDELDFSLTILVIGKCGVGKSSTINSIFGEEKAKVGAFEPGTKAVRVITGLVDGVKIKVIDTPGLKSAVMEQAFNRKVLSSVKSFTKKSPPDIVLYVDRLDTQTRDLNDLPLLKTITTALGQPIWRSAIVTLTHGASAPPDGPTGNPLNYDVSVTQRSHIVQQSIGHAVGDLRMMSPSLMNPVSLVENHPMCRKNRDGQKVLPNGQTWKPQLLLLCYSMKILAEANSISKPQDPFDHRKLFGFRARSPPLPYLLSSMLQSRAHPKLPSDQGIDNGDSDVDMADFSDSDDENEEDEYDQLPPFKPLRKAQVEKLSKEQRKAYFEEYDYRVKLLQKKQWREEVRRVKELKKSEKTGVVEYDPNQEMDEAPAPVATPLPDMVLPNTFDSANPAYRYRFLEPTSQFLARPVLDNHGWDHDCGYDGVNVEQTLALASKFPGAISVQLTKDKKDFSIHMDSSLAVKHGEDGSTMAGFDIQNVGKQLAYIVRGETKFKNFKKNKTAGGVSVTFLGENVATGLKLEDQIAFGKQWAMVGSAGTVRCQGDAAYGANFELQRRELDYPIGQVQSTYGLSLIKWRGDWALGFNSVAQFTIGRNSKVAVRAGLNNKMSGQITVKTSSSDHLSLALTALLPIASAIYKKLSPASAGDSYSIY